MRFCSSLDFENLWKTFISAPSDSEIQKLERKIKKYEEVYAYVYLELNPRFS